MRFEKILLDHRFDVTRWNRVQIEDIGDRNLYRLFLLQAPSSVAQKQETRPAEPAGLFHPVFYQRT